MQNLQEWITGLFPNSEDANVKIIFMDSNGKTLNQATYKRTYDIPSNFIETAYRMQSYTVEYSNLTPYTEVYEVTIYLVRKNTSTITLEDFINILPLGEVDMKGSYLQKINIPVYLYVDTFKEIDCVVTFDARYGAGICGDEKQVKRFNSYGKNYVKTIVPLSGALHICIISQH